jgi:hypothetical protein
MQQHVECRPGVCNLFKPRATELVAGRTQASEPNDLYTVCPQSPFGVLKNCGAQTNWASHMRFAADYSKTLEAFLPPTDGISGHLYVSQLVVCEMATVQERARYVGWIFETKSVTQTQRNYRTQFNKQPPSDNAIRDWHRRFLETGSVHDRKRSGRPGVSDECVERIRESFVRSPTKSTRRASRKLLLPRSTVHKVLHKRLRLCAYNACIMKVLEIVEGELWCVRIFFVVVKCAWILEVLTVKGYCDSMHVRSSHSDATVTSWK